MKTNHYHCLAVVAALFAGSAVAQDEVPLRWSAFAHFDADRRESAATDFDVGLARARVDLHRDRWDGVFVVDLARDNPGDSPPGALPAVVFDLFATVDLGASELVIGQAKLPVSMEFAEPASRLDIPKRGMEKGLDLDRAPGLTLRGRRLAGGLGYDVGVYNLAGRSAATRHTSGQAGDDLAWAARIMLDRGPFHVEASTGRSQAAGGPGTADYDVTSVGVRWRTDSWSLKGETIAGRDIRGVAGRDERVWFVHAGYRVAPRTELIVRHYEGRSTVAADTTRLSNSYIGAIYRMVDRGPLQIRAQLDYQFAGGDGSDYTGLRALRSDGVLAQLQVSFNP